MNESDRKKLIIILICAPIILIYICLTAFFDDRTTYDSEEEMKIELQGTYVNYYLVEPKDYLAIEGDFLIHYTPAISDLGPWKQIYKITKWNYRTGMFKTETGKKYIINKLGGIKVGKKEFDKDTLRHIPYSLPSSYDYETKRSDLELTVNKVDSDSKYSFCTGSIKNIGKKSFKYIKVEGVFLDESGNKLDEVCIYVAYREGLAPEQTVNFRLETAYNRIIDSCTVTADGYES